MAELVFYQRQVAVAGNPVRCQAILKHARVVCLWATHRLGNRSPRSNTGGR